MTKEFAQGNIPGFAHVYIGQEASGVGVCFDLTDDDYIGSTHRGHGHCIAKGCDVQGMMLEIMGKQGGLCGGKGGSMHIADMSKGMLGANAIVGGSPPIAVGAALTQKLKKTGSVAVAFSGDGASNQGTTFEALNMAVVLGVPAIFAFENNGYGEHTASSYAVGAPSIAERAKSFGMPAEVVDGSDFFAVREAMGRALERGRSGEGPYALEIVCSRFLGHFIGDPQGYRLPEELARARANDPAAALPHRRHRSGRAGERRPRRHRAGDRLGGGRGGAAGHGGAPPGYQHPRKRRLRKVLICQRKPMVRRSTRRCARKKMRRPIPT